MPYPPGDRRNRLACAFREVPGNRRTVMAYQFITAEQRGAVAVITLNRPDKLNALSFALMRELDEALSGYESAEAVRAVVLTGAGERAFSAGADIHEMAGLSSEELAARSEFRNRATWRIASYAKPLIGAINGLAYGGAALLASTLELLVGLPKAKELLDTGRAVGAEEALAIGLLNQIVPAAQVVAAAVAL